MFIPKENEKEAVIIPDVEIIGVESLAELVSILT